MVTFHDAVLSDAEEITRVHNRSAEQMGHLHGPGHWSEPVPTFEWERAIRSSDVRVRVGVSNETGRIVTALRLLKRIPWDLDTTGCTSCARKVYLTAMVVVPPCQGQGIGRAALRDAMRCTKASIWLEVYQGPAGAGPFYEKCGFTRCGDTTYHGVPLTLYELRR